MFVLSLGNVVYFTASNAPDSVRILRQEPTDGEAQSVNIVLFVLLPPMVSDSLDWSVAEIADAPVMVSNRQEVKVVAEALSIEMAGEERGRSFSVQLESVVDTESLRTIMLKSYVTWVDSDTMHTVPKYKEPVEA